MDIITITAIAVILVASHAAVWAIGVVQGSHKAAELISKQLSK